MKPFFIHSLFFACLLAFVPAQAAQDKLIPFEIIESGGFSGIQNDKPEIYSIKDPANWDAFWSQHNTITPGPKTQSIDFEHKQVIAVVDIDQPNSGYTLHINRIEKHNDELWVHVTREQPGTSCLNLGVVSQPFVVVMLDRVDGAVKLVLNTKSYGC